MLEQLNWEEVALQNYSFLSAGDLLTHYCFLEAGAM